MRDHLSWKTTYFWQKDLHLNMFNAIEPVTQDHLSWETIFFMASVSQDRFYCNSAMLVEMLTVIFALFVGLWYCIPDFEQKQVL